MFCKAFGVCMWFMFDQHYSDGNSALFPHETVLSAMWGGTQ